MEETGTTFEENAYIKSSFTSRVLGLPALADDSVMVVSGTVVSVDPNSGKVAVLNETGKTVMLTAGPDNDLKALQKGDEVTVEYDKKSVIQSINVQH